MAMSLQWFKCLIFVYDGVYMTLIRRLAHKLNWTT